MTRKPAAIAAILVFVPAWVVAAAIAADRVGPMHGAVQAAYFITAGTVWVFPVRWLMLWSAHQR